MCHDYLVEQNILIKGIVGLDLYWRKQSEHRLPLCPTKIHCPHLKN